MISLPKFLATAIIIGSSGLTASANPNQAAAEVGVLVEYIQVDRATASKLVHEYDGDGTILRLQLQKLVDAGSGQIVDSAYLHAREWDRQTAESIDEFIYPTEYESPFGPDAITGKVAPTANLMVASAPTAFDVRNTGHTLGLQAEVSPGTDIISLKLSTTLAEYVGDQDYGSGDTLAVQPTFDSLRDQTYILAKSGSYSLVAMHAPRAAEGVVARDPSKRVLVMLRATILKAGPEPVRKKEPVKTPPHDPNDPFSASYGEPANPVQIGTLVEYIKVQAAIANRLAREHATDRDASAFREKIAGFITDGRAEELDSSYILSIAGKRTKTESHHELIYPTEYDPPSFGLPPQAFDRPEDAATGLPIHPLPPTAFDVRNVGSSFEVEPNVDSELKLISLNARPQLVDFIDFLNYGEGHALSVQPVFFSLDSQSNLRVPNGGLSLVSMQMAHDETATGADSARLDPAYRVLVFVKSTVFEMPPADEKK